jgi:hypothetical protein
MKYALRFTVQAFHRAGTLAKEKNQLLRDISGS